MLDLNALIDAISSELDNTEVAYYRIVDNSTARDTPVLVTTCCTMQEASNYLYHFPQFIAMPVSTNALRDSSASELDY